MAPGPSEDCVALLKRIEGFSATPYPCGGGRWTIGYGSRYYEDGREVSRNDAPVSSARADEILRHHLCVRAWGAVARLVKVPLSQNQRDALSLLAYNIGSTAFADSVLLVALNLGDYAGAARQFHRWNKSRGRVMAGLVKRRRLEASMFLAPDPPTSAQPSTTLP